MKKIGLLLSFIIFWYSTQVIARVELPDGKFSLKETEMTVKTAGIDIDITRSWSERRWKFNSLSHRLQPKYPKRRAGRASKSEDFSQKRFSKARLLGIYRGPKFYSNRGNGIFVFDERMRIIATETGYRWLNRNGSWINYDANGYAIDYGNRDNQYVTIVYDTQFRELGLNDGQGNPLVRFTYNDSGQLIGMQDNSTPPREVSYRYENYQLVEAIDVLGNSRFYTYEARIYHVNSPPKYDLKSYTDASGNKTSLSYLYNNRVESVLDKNHIGWTYVYDYDKVKKEYYIRKAHTSGRTLEYWYSKTAKLLRSDENGETIRAISYGPYNQKDTITDHRGLVTVKEYDAYRNLTKTTYPDGSVSTQQVAPEFSNVVQKTNELGIVTHYEYDARGYLSTKIEAVGTSEERRLEYQLDNRGLTTQIKQVGNAVTSDRITQYQYDTRGNVIKVIYALGRVADYTYNDRNNLITYTLYNDAGEPVTTSYDYNASGQLTRKTNPLGQYTTYAYDANGNLSQQSDYDAGGSVISQQSYTYDYRNNLINQTDSLGHAAIYNYDMRDNLVSMTNANNQTQVFKYDLFNRKTDSIDAVGYKTSWQYGQGGSATAGLMEQVDYPTYTENHAYDKRGRLTQKLTQSKLPESPASTTQVVTYTYDKLGNRIASEDVKNRTTLYAYDPLQRLTQSTDNEGKTTRYEYDNRDNLLSVTDANGHVIRRYQYDANNQNISETKALGQQDTQVYNQLGLLKSSTNAMGQVSRYQYNSNNQLTSIERFENSNASAANKTISFAYSPQGLLSSYNDGITSANYSYNQNSQKTSETINYGPFSKTHQYSYNNTGQKASFTNGENVTVQYSYNANDQIEQIQIPSIGFLTYSYSNGNVEQISFPGNSNQYWRYDGIERPEGILVQDLSQAVLDSRDYQYDASNNIVQQIIREGKLAYQYNNLDRLTQVNFAAHQELESDYNHNTTYPPKNENYSYDPVGNRLSSHETADNWSYNDNNELQQYTQDGQAVNFQYNANGQLIQKTIDTVNTYYAYNLDGRLQSIKGHDQKTIASYTYDPFGRRISKTLYHADETQSTVYYVYSDEGLIAEYNQTGELIQSYGYAPNSSFTTNPLYSHRPDFADSSGYVYYINDHLGTPKKIITNTGRIVWFGESEAFGETTLVKNEYRNPLRFPGQYLDDESGLHYNFWRYYEPQLGRYITSDPIGLKGGLNNFLYTDANPLNDFDALGLISEKNMPCQYYRKACSEYGCFYYCHSAKMICANAELAFPFIIDGTTDENLKCVKRCLVQEDDSLHKQKKSPDSCDDDGCFSDEEIDNYHYVCFSQCGLDPDDYPGVWPFNGF